MSDTFSLFELVIVLVTTWGFATLAFDLPPVRERYRVRSFALGLAACILTALSLFMFYPLATASSFVNELGGQAWYAFILLLLALATASFWLLFFEARKTGGGNRSYGRTRRWTE